jgi:hypothetical protein
MNRTSRNIASLVVLALVVSACGGPGASAVPPGGQAQSVRHASLHVSIKIPKKHPRRRGAPKFVSPATQSMSIHVTGPTNVSEAVGLTISSGNCTSTLASTECALTIPGLAIGTGYSASISTYDGPVSSGNVSGNLLSSGQNVAFAIVAGTNNAIQLTLQGVPVTTIVTPADSLSAPNGTAFHMYGLGKHRFIVESLDADNNPIVGPGMPSYTFGTVSGLGVTVTATSAGSNVFSISPPGALTAGTGTFTITPNFDGQPVDGCAQTGANCSAVTVKVSMYQMIAIASGSNVSLYGDDATPPTLLTTLSGFNAPSYVTTDSSGDLFVANQGSAGGGSGNGGVDVFAPPYTGTPSTLSGTGVFPTNFAFDSSQNLYLIENSDILVYAPPYTGPPTTTLLAPSSGGGRQLAIDASGNVYAAWFSDQVIGVYNAPITGGAPSWTVSNNVSEPTALALHNSTLYVSNDVTNNVTTYALPITSNSTTASFISGAGPAALLSLAVDPSGNIFTTGCGTGCAGPGLLSEFSAPYTTTPTATTTNGVNSFPWTVSLDAAGNIFAGTCAVDCVADSATTEYAPPFTNDATGTALSGATGQVSILP